MTDSLNSQSKLCTSVAIRLEEALDNFGSPTSTHHETLVDLLTNAMHWCDYAGGDFQIALAQAGRHYLAELTDQQRCERRLSLCR